MKTVCNICGREVVRCTKGYWVHENFLAYFDCRDIWTSTRSENLPHQYYGVDPAVFKKRHLGRDIIVHPYSGSEYGCFDIDKLVVQTGRKKI